MGGLAVEGYLKIYTDTASGTKSDRPQWNACLKNLRPGDTLIVWKIDRLGRNLRDLIDIVTTLQKRGVGVRSLTNAIVDTTTAHGALVFGVFALMAEYEAALIRERTQAGLAAARARGRHGGRKPKMTPALIDKAQRKFGGQLSRGGVPFGRAAVGTLVDPAAVSAAGAAHGAEHRPRWQVPSISGRYPENSPTRLPRVGLSSSRFSAARWRPHHRGGPSRRVRRTR